MDGWFSRSFIKAASASGGFSFPSAGRPLPAHRRLKGESALPGNAVPAAVLAQAMPQLARLSPFRTSLELQLLFQCMHQVVEAHGQPAGPGTTPPGTQDGGFIIKRPGPDLTAGARLESPETDPAPRRNLSNPVGHADRDDDDDFPDTKAFDDEEVPVPMPMPPVDRGAAMGASEAPMPVHPNRRLRLGHAGFIHTF